jgi:hypothetical protein
MRLHRVAPQRLERLPLRKAAFETPFLPAAESPRIQYAVAEAQMKIDLALLLSRSICQFIHELGVNREPCQRSN